MLKILQKYNELPENIRAKVSGDDVMKTLDDLEKKYEVSLANVVLRVMINDIPFRKLKGYFMFETDLKEDLIDLLVLDLKTKVFKGVYDFLGIEAGGNNDSVAVGQAVGGHVLKSKKTDSVPGNSIADQEIQKEKSSSSEKENIDYDSISLGDDLSDKIDEKTSTSEVQTVTLQRDSNKKEQNIPKKGLQIEAKSGKDQEVIPSSSTGVKKVASVLPSNIDVKLPKEDSIRKFEEKPKNFLEGENKQSEEDKALELMKKLGISFASEELQIRFKKVLKTGINGVRNKIALMDVLKKDVNRGGMGLDDLTVEKIVGDLNLGGDTSSLLKKKPKPVVTQDKGSKQKGANLETLLQGMDRDIEYDFNNLKKKDQVVSPVQAKMVQSAQSEKKEEAKEVPSLGDIESVENSKKNKRPSNPGEEKEDSSPSSSHLIKGGQGRKVERVDPVKAQEQEKLKEKPKEKRVNLNVRNIAPEKEGRMADIKKMPKVMGPVDELRVMDLKVFRRLGKNARKSAMKIKEMVENLEKDGYSHRLKGIKAWRNSPINKMYIQLGSESIEKKAEIDVILASKQLEKGDFLSKEEFRAIMDLNRELRF